MTSGKFVRASKYRHVFGQAAKKELCYENLKITKNAWDSNIIQANGKYISVNWEASGGGAFAIIPVGEVGKAPDKVPLFRGHTGPVLDSDFDPFSQQRIASCSDDGKICLWDIPEDFSFRNYVDENDNVRDITEPSRVLNGHTRKVGRVQFHPCAENVLASSSMDYTVKIWNLETGKDKITLEHKDLVTSFCFNYNGTLLATTSRDKKLRIWDLKSGKILSEGLGHTGAKPSRVVWLGNTNRIVTTGFSKLSDRQVAIWDVENIDKGPIDGFLYIDSSSGVLIPVFDQSTSILYLAGKGDGNIRYYEYDSDVLHDLSQYTSIDPQRGFTASPKSAVNVKENEILKAYKTVNDNSIEPISFIVPRRSELFQLDIYPDCPSRKPALTASEFFEGKTCNGPLLMSMKALYEGSSPEIRESTPVAKISQPKVDKEDKEKDSLPTPKNTPSKDESSVTVSSSGDNNSEKALDQETEAKPKNVDEVLKGSAKVDDLLDKVNNQSDEEKDDQQDDGDADWEEEKQKEEPAKISSIEKAPSVLTENNDRITATLSKESKVSSSGSINDENNSSGKDGLLQKLQSPAPDFKDQKPLSNSEKSLQATETPKTGSLNEQSQKSPEKTTSGAPTLKNTIAKLAEVVHKLEAEVDRLSAVNSDKDARLASLEEKIEKLLNSGH